MLAKSDWSRGTITLANVTGIIRPASGTAYSGDAPHSAMNGQSLPQSGMEALPAQQGISSEATTIIASEIAMGALIDIGSAAGIPAAARATGANTKPKIAISASK